MGVPRTRSYGKDILAAALAPAVIGIGLVVGSSGRDPWVEIGCALTAFALGVALGRSMNAVGGIMVLVLAGAITGLLVQVEPSTARSPMDLLVAHLLGEAICIAVGLGILGVASGAALRRHRSNRGNEAASPDPNCARHDA
jgi:hypothetical protein